MKKIGFVIFGILVAGIFLNSCDTGSEAKPNSNPILTQYYYYEVFRITKANYNTVSTPSSATFSAIKSYRDSLYNLRVSFAGSGTDMTQNDIYTLLTTRGFSVAETNNEIFLLNTVGNDVLTFEDAESSNNYVIVYLQKI